MRPKSPLEMIEAWEQKTVNTHSNELKGLLIQLNSLFSLP